MPWDAHEAQNSGIRCTKCTRCFGVLECSAPLTLPWLIDDTKRATALDSDSPRDGDSMDALDPRAARALSLLVASDDATDSRTRAARSGERPKAERAAESGLAVASGASGGDLDSTQSWMVVHQGDERDEDAPDGDGSRRAVRWGARALLWQASTLKPVRQCGRVLRDDPGAPSTGAGVKRRVLSDRPIAGYSGVVLCGSVWSCPRCSAVIAQRRSEEIGRAVAACHQAGGSVYLMTLTIRHNRGDRLADLFAAISKGWAGAFHSQSWKGVTERSRMKRGRRIIVPEVLGDAARFGVAGRIRSTEATVSLPERGGHGWHLHFHVLLFTVNGLGDGLREDLDDVIGRLFARQRVWDRETVGRLAFGTRLFGRYARAVERAGYRADPDGFDIRPVSKDASEFVGSYLAKSTYDVAIKLGMEVAAGSQTKEARTARNVTPFEVLARCAQELSTRSFGIRTPRHWEVVELEDGLGVLDLDSGEITAFTSPGLWKLWHEWERGSRGRRQIVWSRMISDDSARAALWDLLLGVRGEAHDDEELAQTELRGDLLGEIPREAWYGRLVWRPAWLVEALETAEKGGREDLAAYLSSRGVAFTATAEGDASGIGEEGNGAHG